MIARIWAELVICVEPTAVITSPAFRPASSAALPLFTVAMRTPLPVSAGVTPSSACCALPLEISCAAIDLTVFDGTANPTPSLPPPSLWICDVIPITSPRRLSSGPPELPWLIAASVWIAPSIGVSFGEEISRPTALTMPLVTVPSRPNGLPIATTPSPTVTFELSASASGTSFEDGAFTCSTAMSVEESEPTTFAV